MSKINCRRCFTIIISLFLVSLFFAGPATAKTEKLRFQCVYPETSNAGTMVKKFKKRIEKYSNGQIEVKLFWPGQISKVQEAYNAVSKGMLDGVLAAPIYYGGILPEVKLEYLPLTWKTPEEAYEFYYEKGFADFLQKAHTKHGVHLLGTWFSGTMAFMVNFDAKGLDDLKGKKIRAMSSDGPLVRKMEIAPVSMAGTEIYMAMQRKTIDGTIYPIYVLDTYNLHEVTETVILPGIHSPNPLAIYLNKKFYDGLEAELQFALDRACEEISLLTAIFSDNWDEDALQTAQKKSVKIIHLSEAEKEKLHKMAAETWKKIAETSPNLKNGVDLMIKHLR